MLPTEDLTYDSSAEGGTGSVTVTPATSAPSGLTWFMSTMVALTFPLSSTVSSGSRAGGHMSNTSMSGVSMAVTGCAADDLTAATENTKWY